MLGSLDATGRTFGRRNTSFINTPFGRSSVFGTACWRPLNGNDKLTWKASVLLRFDSSFARLIAKPQFFPANGGSQMKRDRADGSVVVAGVYTDDETLLSKGLAPLRGTAECDAMRQLEDDAQFANGKQPTDQVRAQYTAQSARMTKAVKEHLRIYVKRVDANGDVTLNVSFPASAANSERPTDITGSFSGLAVDHTGDGTIALTGWRGACQYLFRQLIIHEFGFRLPNGVASAASVVGGPVAEGISLSLSLSLSLFLSLSLSLSLCVSVHGAFACGATWQETAEGCIIVFCMRRDWGNCGCLRQRVVWPGRSR